MLIYFPSMHVELLPLEPLAGAVFFDPGLDAESPDDGYYRPGNLPVSPKQGQALIRDSISFGEQFKDPSEMAFFGTHTPEDYFNESTSTIKSELMKRLRGEADAEVPAEIANAQFTLMLAWHLEKSIIETQGLEKGVRASWDKFGKTLGMDEGDDDEQSVALGRIMSSTTLGSGGGVFPWQRVMEAMPAFLPENAMLVTREGDATALWQEYGIGLAAVSEEMGLPEGSLLAEARAWQLAGRKRIPEQLPWTDRIVKVAIVKADSTEEM